MSEKNVPKTYFIYDSEKSSIKIGTSKDPNNRLRQLQVGNPSKLSLLGYMHGDFEQEFHNAFSQKKLSGEWFNADKDFINYLLFLEKIRLAEIDEKFKDSQNLKNLSLEELLQRFRNNRAKIQKIIDEKKELLEKLEKLNS